MRLEYAPGISVEVPDADLPEYMAERQRQLDINALLGYIPHSKQQPFHAAVLELPIRAFVGGNRSGKSTAGVVDDLIQALPWEWVPDHLKQYKKWDPPFYCRIVLPGFGRPMEAVLEAVRRWVPRGALRGGDMEHGWDKQAKVLHFECGSFIEVMTYEQDEDKFGGTARHRIHWDEEVPDTEKGQTIRDECSARLIDYNGDEIFTYTPLQGLGYTFEELWEKRGKEVEPQVWRSDSLLVVQADMDDNPTLSEEGKERALAKYPENIKDARKRGDYVHFKGLVYSEFDETLHVVDKPPIDHVRQLEVLVGIDPGIRTTAVSFCGFDKDNSMLVFDELYLHDEGAIPENAAVSINAKLALWGVIPKWFLIDPSARNRSLVNAENVQAAYDRAGITAYPGQNEVEAGVFEVKRRMQAKDHKGDPQPLLHVSRECENWIKERRAYRIDDKEGGPFAVVKKKDHLMDATRYVAMAHPLPSPPPPGTAPAPVWVPGTAPPANFTPMNNTPSPPMGALS